MTQTDTDAIDYVDDDGAMPNIEAMGSVEAFDAGLGKGRDDAEAMRPLRVVIKAALAYAGQMEARSHSDSNINEGDQIRVAVMQLQT